MDFLDPKAKRRRTIQLFVGYGLMATLISLITLILVFQAYGFDVDRKTGEVIQNGLIFVDSAPDKATVKLNGQEQKNKTNNRFALPSGNYTMTISKTGYREWKRTFDLNGGEVERFTYPLLIPSKLDRTELQTVDTAPSFVSESPDRRWAITNQGSSFTNFTEYDFNNLTNNNPAVRQFVLPDGLFTADTGPQSLELVEWSTDNKHLLVKHSFAQTTEFVVISRDQPATSININSLLGQNPTAVTLRDKKYDQWYLFTQTGGLLTTANSKKEINQVVSGVTAYKSHDSDTLLYATNASDGKVQRVILRQGDKSYIVKDIANGNVALDIARYDGSWYVLIGSDAEQKTYIYRDPVTVLQRNDGIKPSPRTILKTPGPIQWMAFSQNTRFTVAQTGQHFEVYDAEQNQSFHYDLPIAIDPGVKVAWMDGHRMLARSSGKAIMFDFDGSNRQELSNDLSQAPVMFDRDYTVMYTLDGSVATAGKYGVYSTSLRLAGDK